MTDAEIAEHARSTYGPSRVKQGLAPTMTADGADRLAGLIDTEPPVTTVRSTGQRSAS